LLILEQYASDPVFFPVDRGNLTALSSRWIIQTVDNALVGRYSKPEESDKTLWKHRACVLRDLLVIVFLCEMKLYHTIIGLTLIVAISVGCQKKEEKVQTVSEQAPAANDLPTMPITFLDGTTVQAKSLTGSSILILFQPDCDHCQREAQEFQKNLSAFNNYTLYFISSVGIPETEAFAKQYGLDGQANVKFGITAVENVLNNFGAISAPSMYIYNGSGKLVKKFNGETDIQQILEAI
jgi:peroxiredoxin